MNADLDRVKALLYVWADWATRDSSGLGWSHESAMHRIRRQGPVGAAIRRPPGPGLVDAMPPGVKTVEKAILAMPDDLQAVLLSRYNRPRLT